MQMEMYTKDSGSMIKLMEKVPTHMLMELITTEIGSTISNTDSVWNLGLMVQSMRETI
jgi:hypothetical protein